METNTYRVIEALEQIYFSLAENANTLFENFFTPSVDILGTEYSYAEVMFGTTFWLFIGYCVAAFIIDILP